MKTVRDEVVRLFDNFKDAVNDENYKEQKVEVEDFNYPETIEIGSTTYRKKWINNRRTYVALS